MVGSSDALDGNSALTVQLVGISLVALLLAVFQTLALVVFQQPVLPAKVAGAEAAVTDNALGGVLAFLEATPYLLRRHAAAQGEGHVQGGIGWELQRGEGGGGRGEVLAGVHEAQVGGGQVMAEGEDGGEGGYRGGFGKREGDCCGDGG